MRDSDEKSLLMMGRARASLLSRGAESERPRMNRDRGDTGVGDGLVGGAGVGGVGLLKDRGVRVGREGCWEGMAGSNLCVTGCAVASCSVVELGSVGQESRESVWLCEYGEELTPDRGATSSGKSFTTRPDGDMTCMVGALKDGVELIYSPQSRRSCEIISPYSPVPVWVSSYPLLSFREQ